MLVASRQLHRVGSVRQCPTAQRLQFRGRELKAVFARDIHGAQGTGVTRWAAVQRNLDGHQATGIADDAGEPNPDLPVNVMRIEFESIGGVTRMTIRSTFPTVDAMEQTLAMGAEEGMKAALGQIDDLLAA